MAYRALGLVVGVGALLLGSTAQAHVTLTNPMNRYGDMAYDNAYQKDSPCGAADNPPGTLPPVVYQAGETITITVDEYVQHPGMFRIAISGSDQDFIAPTGPGDIGDDPSTVLVMDDLQDGGQHQIEVTLPDTPCDPCVLQFIQLMMDGGSFSGNYYQCADIVIEGDVSATSGGGSTGGSDTADPTAGSTSTTGTASDTASTTDPSTSAGSDGGSSGGSTGASSGSTDALPTGGSMLADSGCGCITARDPIRPWSGLWVLLLFRRRRHRS